MFLCLCILTALLSYTANILILFQSSQLSLPRHYVTTLSTFTRFYSICLYTLLSCTA